MSNYKTCKKCGSELTDDAMAIYRKMVFRGADEFLCIPCLAEYFKVEVSEIEARIRFYRESGHCTLFR